MEQERRILKSQKNVFWEALVIAVFIFGTGVFIGIWIETNRASEISDMYSKSELNLLDVKAQTEILNLQDVNCPQAIKKNIEFGDKVFEDALTLQKYEDANRITSSLVDRHKEYDLLRTILWINSIKIKAKCNNALHTVVYLYDYLPETLEEKSKQEVFSTFLQELKSDKGDDVILIPIARNLDISSLDMLASNYKINSTSIIVDEKLVITDISNVYKVKSVLNIK